MKPIKRILTAMYFVVALIVLFPIFIVISIFLGMDKANSFMDNAILVPLIKWWE
jgi:lipopolysaccharide/colanic/teichoic acid biosynthesis glycosyltransferase